MYITKDQEHLPPLQRAVASITVIHWELVLIDRCVYTHTDTHFVFGVTSVATQLVSSLQKIAVTWGSLVIPLKTKPGSELGLTAPWGTDRLWVLPGRQREDSMLPSSAAVLIGSSCQPSLLRLASRGDHCCSLNLCDTSSSRPLMQLFGIKVP